MNSWYTIRAQTTGAEVVIYDEIGAYGVSAKGFLAELAALPDATPLVLRINSPGGSVFDAVAIYNALLRHSGAVTVWIDGIAASAASYIAMAGDEVVMPENAFLMIHDPAGMVMGSATDMRAMAEALDKIAGSLIRGYAAKSGKPDEDIAALMAAETWLDAKDALDLGLADRIAEPVRIAARFDIARFRNAPPDLVEAVQPVEEPEAESDPEPLSDGSASEEGADAEVGPEAADESVGADNASDAEGARAETGPPPDPEEIAAVPAAATNVAAIRAEAMAYARAVVDLCRLAGQLQMAADFLAAEATLDAVRKALIEARVATEPAISSAHPQPGPGSNACPWGDVIARTFKRKG